MRDPLRCLQWEGNVLWILDQRQLPGSVEWIEARDCETVAAAIESLAVRGAPAIGIAAGYGVALAARASGATKDGVKTAIERLRRTRPTGFNLFSALSRLQTVLDKTSDLNPANLLLEAAAIHAEDEAACNAMAEFGVSLIRDGESVLTYCNTGSLATGGIGTALGIIKHGYALGKVAHVYACESRPVGQGARLTVWECVQASIPVTLICDNMAASLMKQGKVNRVFVGADRITANGDTSNKIGTLMIAALANQFSIPFHVAAPTTTFDTSLSVGSQIPIEERPSREVTGTVPGLERLSGFSVWNPAFDITPSNWITSFVTEKGIQHPPFN